LTKKQGYQSLCNKCNGITLSTFVMIITVHAVFISLYIVNPFHITLCLVLLLFDVLGIMRLYQFCP